MDPRFTDIQACVTVQPQRPSFPDNIPVEEAISMNGQTWQPGDVIGIGFLDGSVTQRKKAQRWIEYWLQAANLHFDFATARPDARITFRPGGSWSYIGTGCRGVTSGPTMQLGWVTDVSEESADRAVIVHEAGHMLGLGHEQSHPANDIHWNKPLAMEYYQATQGWTAQMVQDNVFAVFDPSAVTGTEYDRKSIMQYPVPAQLTTDGRGIPFNDDWDALDQHYIGVLYPGALPPLPPIPPLPPLPPIDTLLPVVTIGQPATRAMIPAPGEPARFSLDVPRKQNLNLIISVEPAYGGEPLVRLGSSAGITKLGLHNGNVTYRFGRGHYTIGVWNPRPRQTGVASVRARHAPG